MASFVSQLPATPAQVILIRHAEKDAQGNLSQKGYERAGALAAYFDLTPVLTNFGPPFAIFAARPNPPVAPFHPDENTERCLQTVAPTAFSLKLPIHPGYDKLQFVELADFVLNNPLYDGKNILICWHHDTLPQLAQALGIANPPVYPAGSFDLTWLITYDPAPLLRVKHQQLLFGDSVGDP